MTLTVWPILAFNIYVQCLVTLQSLLQKLNFLVALDTAGLSIRSALSITFKLIKANHLFYTILVLFLDTKLELELRQHELDPRAQVGGIGLDQVKLAVVCPLLVALAWAGTSVRRRGRHEDVPAADLAVVHASLIALAAGTALHLRWARACPLVVAMRRWRRASTTVGTAQVHALHVSAHPAHLQLLQPALEILDVPPSILYLGVEARENGRIVGRLAHDIGGVDEHPLAVDLFVDVAGDIIVVIHLDRTVFMDRPLWVSGEGTRAVERGVWGVEGGPASRFVPGLLSCDEGWEVVRVWVGKADAGCVRGCDVFIGAATCDCFCSGPRGSAEAG